MTLAGIWRLGGWLLYLLAGLALGFVCYGLIVGGWFGLTDYGLVACFASDGCCVCWDFRKGECLGWVV